MSFKSSFGALEDAGGSWLGFCILIMILIWSGTLLGSSLKFWSHSDQWKVRYSQSRISTAQPADTFSVHAVGCRFQILLILSSRLDWALTISSWHVDTCYRHVSHIVQTCFRHVMHVLNLSRCVPDMFYKCIIQLRPDIFCGMGVRMGDYFYKKSSTFLIYWFWYT